MESIDVRMSLVEAVVAAEFYTNHFQILKTRHVECLDLEAQVLLIVYSAG